MKISKNDISLPGKLRDYIVNMSSDDFGELRILVYILSLEGETDTKEICNTLGIAEDEVVAAVSFWRGMGLVNAGGRARGAKTPADTSQKPTVTLPNSVRDTETRTYTGEEIAQIVEKKPEILSLRDFAQERLGKILSRSEFEKLVYLEDYILLSAPMIMRIIDYCVEMDKKSMRYVEKTAIDIYDRGIQTYSALEQYFEKIQRARGNEGVVRGIIGIGERNFTEAEKKHIEAWFGEYNFTPDIISLAYEKTIASISKPSVAYMSKMLKRWHEAGYKTVTDIKEAKASAKGKNTIDLSSFDEAIPADKAVNSENKAGMNLDDFFENN